MKRGHTVVCWAFSLVSAGACVKLDQPQVVAECAKSGTCGDNLDGSLPSDVAQSFESGGNDVDRISADSAPPETFVDVPFVDASFDGNDISPPPAPDAPEVKPDVGTGACLTATGLAPAGTECRKAYGLCDVAEVCDGVSAECPADVYAPAATVCRPAAGDCDIAESCTGFSPDCPSDAFMSAGTVCRMAADVCDVAESCSGTSGECPVDRMEPAGTSCRASSDKNQCDPVETCTGSAVKCPADVIYVRPEAPTGVGGVAGTLQATISWKAVAGATGYNVKRSLVSGSGYTIQGTPPTATASPYVNTGLTGGVVYYYVVSSITTIASCESLADSAEVLVKPTGTCSPPAPPTVTATPSNGQVTLNWTASTGATSYSVARSTTSGTGYASVADVSTGTTYSDINVTNGTTYYYVVTASNGSCSSANSVEVSAAPTCIPPAAPTGLVATPNNGSVALAWTASTDAVSYRVLRSTTAGSGYVLVGTSGTAGYTDTNVTNGTVYYYVVTASNGACNSTNSAEVFATPACKPPSTPTGLTATAGNAKVVLAWTPSTGGATSYQVLRGTTTGGPYTAIATPTSAGYTDSAVTNGTTYYYVVSASNGSCSSGNSTQVSAAPSCIPPSAPAVPTASPGDGKVTLSWTAPAGSPASYTVSRGTATGGPYTAIANPTVTSYTDSTVTNGVRYYYVVSASNGSCSSANSPEVAATPIPACTQAAPTGVQATAGSQQVTLTWTAASGATSYSIGRSTTSGSGYASVGTSTTTTFVDTTGLVNGTTYYYVVTASNANCSSGNSTQVSATPACGTLAAPTGVAAAANSNNNGSIDVTWSPVTDATAYTVSRGTASGGPFTAIKTGQTAANYTDTDSTLVRGTDYYYVVKATNAGGTCSSANSSPAATARSCSSPGTPTGVTATAGISRVDVSWTAVTGATSYNVLRSASSDSGYSSIGTPSVSPFVDSNVTNGTTYYYEVVASNANGNCSSPASSNSSTAPRSCTVSVGTGNTGGFGTTDGKCFVTCDKMDGWNCSYTDGRTVNINGRVLDCGAVPIPAAKTPGYNVIDVSAGTYSWASLAWWNDRASTCSIPAGGLDF